MSKDKTTGCCVLNFKDLKILTDLLVEMLDIVSKLKVTTRHEYNFFTVKSRRHKLELFELELSKQVAGRCLLEHRGEGA